MLSAKARIAVRLLAVALLAAPAAGCFTPMYAEHADGSPALREKLMGVDIPPVDKPNASREARIARGLAATKPMKLDAAQQKRLLRLYQQGEPVSELTSMFGISRSTLFRTLKVLKKQEPVSA